MLLPRFHSIVRDGSKLRSLRNGVNNILCTSRISTTRCSVNGLISMIYDLTPMAVSGVVIHRLSTAIRQVIHSFLHRASQAFSECFPRFFHIFCTSFRQLFRAAFDSHFLNLSGAIPHDLTSSAEKKKGEKEALSLTCGKLMA